MPTKTISAVTVDTSGMDAKLKHFDRNQLPFAKALALTSLARDTIRIEKFEMQQVFDKPKPFVLGGLRMLKTAKKRDPRAVIGFTDVSGRYGDRVEDIVRTHITGVDRGAIPAEKTLRTMGAIGGDEYLIRGKNAPVDRYGNTPLKIWKAAIKGLSRNRRSIAARNRPYDKAIYRVGKDRWFVGAYGEPLERRKRRKKDKPELIWIISDQPKYRKRFEFYEEAQQHAAKFGPYFARKAMDKALATAR